MSELATAEIVPENVLKREPDLYTILFHCAADGISIEDARSLLRSPLDKDSFYQWKKRYPDWYKGILARAVEDATEVRQAALRAAYAKREALQWEIDKDIIAAAPGLIRTLIASAQDEECSTRLRIEITSKLGQWLQRGFGFHVEAPAETEESEEATFSTLRMRLPPPPGGLTGSFHVEATAPSMIDVTPTKAGVKWD